MQYVLKRATLNKMLTFFREIKCDFKKFLQSILMQAAVKEDSQDLVGGSSYMSVVNKNKV